MEGSEDGILCGSVGSASQLVRAKTDWDVVFDVLDNQFLKALHRNGGDFKGTETMVAVLKQVGTLSCDSE